jgi:hypothetical protein
MSVRNDDYSNTGTASHEARRMRVPLLVFSRQLLLSCSFTWTTFKRKLPLLYRLCHLRERTL